MAVLVVEEGMAFANDLGGSFSCRGVATLVVGVDSFYFVKVLFRETGTV